jgi:hypothetical protein
MLALIFEYKSKPKTSNFGGRGEAFALNQQKKLIGHCSTMLCMPYASANASVPPLFHTLAQTLNVRLASLKTTFTTQRSIKAVENLIF